jgi:hypothetical protein
MLRHAPLALAALAVLALPACGLVGGTDDPRPHAELVVGAWDATTASVLVDVGPTNVSVPVSDLAASGDEQRFTFDDDGTFSFVFDPADDRTIRVDPEGTTFDFELPLPDGPVTLSGTYELDEVANEIHFSTIAGQTADDFHLGYSFSGSSSSRLNLEAEDPETLGRLFGLAGSDYEVFAQYVVGGSLTYGRLL